MEKDKVEKRLEEYEDVFADIFDNLLLKGMGVVRAEELVLSSTSTYSRMDDGSLRGGMRDIRMESRYHERYRLICGIENQTDIDNTMPERVMGYEYADYEAQVKRIMAQNRKEKKSAGARRIFKYQKLNPVITGVLYYGNQEWKSPLRLHEMLQFPPGMEEKLKPYVADYPINLIQVSRLTDEERDRLTSDFWIVAEYLACKDNEDKWRGFIKSEKEILHIEELLDVLLEISKDEHYDKLRNMIKREGRRKEKWSMCKIAETLDRWGFEKGRREGMLVGIEEGRAEGRAEGRTEGRTEGIIAMIQDNLEMGQEKENILKKIVSFFSLTLESALAFYEMVVEE